MKHLLIFALVILLSIPFTSSNSNEIKVEDIVKNFIGLLAQEKFIEASKLFTEDLSKALPVDTLASIWKSIISTLGKFNSILD
ncbi:MAG: DUF3887 domain-containing protein, partial [bacterium]|nr:DUF3887 domain-containing protein [bacterium]